MSNKLSHEELVHVISSIVKQMQETQELLKDTIDKTDSATSTALKIVYGLLHTITGLTLTLMTYEPVVLMELSVKLLAQSIEVDQKLEMALAIASIAMLAEGAEGEDTDLNKALGALSMAMKADSPQDDNVIGPALWSSDE